MNFLLRNFLLFFVILQKWHQNFNIILKIGPLNFRYFLTTVKTTYDKSCV